jgi:DNA-binding Lrp family transcriptional regulator
MVLGMSRVEGELRLDERDRLLIDVLQANAELTLAAMGQRLGLTKMSVSNRIKRLKRAGVLMGAKYLVNPQTVDQDYVVVTQVSCDARGPAREKIAQRIAKIPGVQTVYRIFGPYDILFIARRRDKRSADHLITEVSLIDGVRSTLTTIPAEVIKESLDVSLEDSLSMKPRQRVLLIHKSQTIRSRANKSSSGQWPPMSE